MNPGHFLNSPSPIVKQDLNGLSFYRQPGGWVDADHAASTASFFETWQCSSQYLTTYASIHRGKGYFSEQSTDVYELARQQIQEAVGKDKEVVFTANTTDSLNKIALILPQTEVLTTRIEHSANLLPWIKFHKGLAFLDVADLDEVTPELVSAALGANPKIGVVTLAAASNLTGTRLPQIEQIHAVCQKAGAVLVLDSCQYVPHHGTHGLCADVIVFSGHKMYAPWGAGVLAASPQILSNTSRSLTGGGNVAYIDSDLQVTHHAPPHNQEIGTPNGVGSVAMASALSIIHQKLPIIEETEKTLMGVLGEFRQFLHAHGYVTVGNKNAPVLSVGHASTKHLDSLIEILYRLKISTRVGNFCVHEAIRRTMKTTDPAFVKMVRLSCGMATDVDQLHLRLRLAAKELPALF